jgi:hypothetical protein
MRRLSEGPDGVRSGDARRPAEPRPGDATCIVFECLDAAQRYSEAKVQALPRLRCETARSNPAPFAILRRVGPFRNRGEKVLVFSNAISFLYCYPDVTDRPMTEVNLVVRSRHGLCRHHGLGAVGGRRYLPHRPPALPARAVHAYGPDDAKSAIAYPPRTGAGIDRGAALAAGSGARAPSLVNVLFRRPLSAPQPLYLPPKLLIPSLFRGGIPSALSPARRSISAQEFREEQFRSITAGRQSLRVWPSGRTPWPFSRPGWAMQAETIATVVEPVRI